MAAPAPFKVAPFMLLFTKGTWNPIELPNKLRDSRRKNTSSRMRIFAKLRAGAVHA